MSDSLEVRDLPVVRIKLGADRPAPQPDPLGRTRIGYLPGLAPHELWARGRGVWKAKLPNVAAAELAVLVADGIVVGIGTIDGVRFIDDRIAITGQPISHHPLIGLPDPLANASRNPIAYGTIHTVRPDSRDEARPADDVLSEAIDILTEAARLRRPRLRQSPAGRWETDPDQSEQADWAEFVSLALAGAAANVGGIDAALAGRPGSWEAAGVRTLLESTVGPDEHDLWQHRTKPIRITFNINDLLLDTTTTHEQYDAAEDELYRRFEAVGSAEAEARIGDLIWVYDIPEHGDPIPRSPGAPAWSLEAWEANRPPTASHTSFSEALENAATARAAGIDGFSLYIPKTPEAAITLGKIDAETAAREEELADLEDRLAQQRQREWADYGNALKAQLETVLRALPGLEVPVEIRTDVRTDAHAARAEIDPIWERYIEAILDTTPTPADLPGTPLERAEHQTS